MSAEKPKEHLRVLRNGVYHPATRADLDKALESLGLRAVSAIDMHLGGELEELKGRVFLAESERDAAKECSAAAAEEYERLEARLNEVRGERDAAVAAKRHMERNWGAARAECKKAWGHHDRLRPVIEAARVWDANPNPFSAGVLRRALRALDAGEGPKPADYTLRDDNAALSAENVQLRSALARAEEENKVLRHDVAELGDDLAGCASLLREVQELRKKLATIVERAAKAQRDSDAAWLKSWGLERTALDMLERPLSTLPEADSSGGGEKSRVGPRTIVLGQLGMHMHQTSAIAAEIASWDSGPCCFCIDDEGDDSDECGAPGTRVTFRRKHDRLTQECFRCEKHRYLTNPAWAPDPAPPKSAEPSPRAYEIEGARLASVVPAPDGGGEAKCHCGRPRFDFIHDGEALTGHAFDPTPQTDGWTDAQCDEFFDLKRTIGAAEIRGMCLAIKWRNKRISDLTENLAAAEEQRRCAVRNNAEWSRRYEALEANTVPISKHARIAADNDRLRAKCSRQRKELRRFNRKQWYIAENWVSIAASLSAAQQRVRTLESSDALARARRRELEAEIAALKSTTHQGE